MTSPDQETINTVLNSIRRALHEDALINLQDPSSMTSAFPHDEITLDPSMMVSPAPDSTSQSEQPVSDTENLMAAQTIAAAEHSLRNLQNAFGGAGTALPADTVISNSSGLTIEDMVRNEVRSMVRTWLDAHLPSLVEILVRGEIARLTPKP